MLHYVSGMQKSLFMGQIFTPPERFVTPFDSSDKAGLFRR